ncbi:MAG: aldo/keto reductase, partial [Gammaproteobacteria bacterium]
NLMYREEEREMLPFCQEEGIGVLPWSPLARGRLARPWNEKSGRLESDEYGKRLYARTAAADQAVAHAVASVASQRGVSMAQVALAWVMQKKPVTAPIIGASRAAHLDDAVAALSLRLTPEEIDKLEEPYLPHAIAGFR